MTSSIRYRALVAAMLPGTLTIDPITINPPVSWDIKPKDWFSYLMRSRSPRLATDPRSYFADIDVTARAVENVYTELFPRFLQTYSGAFFNSTRELVSVPGSIAATKARYRMDDVIFYIVVVLLVGFAGVVMLTYFLRPGRFLDPLPTTLAKTIPLVCNGRLVQDLRPLLEMGPKERERFLDDKDWTFGFGRFPGSGGEMYYGVDRDPVVRKRDWKSSAEAELVPGEQMGLNVRNV